MKDPERTHTRRRFLGVSVAGPAALVLAPSLARAQGRSRPPTPACGAASAPTPRQTAGPYFKPESPRRASLLEPGMPGTRIVVEGVVVRTDCTPVPRALVDVWHADAGGDYDNEGYRCRGHQFTDDAGRYRLETIVPGIYPGRTRHFHVRVQAPEGRVLTSQLYFPEEPLNRRDGIFSPELVMRVRDADGRKQADFDFVLASG